MRALLVFIVCAAFALGQRGDQNSLADALLREAQHPTGNFPEFFSALERRALQASQGAAARTGSILTIRLRSGATRAFPNVGGCDFFEPEEISRCRVFSLVAYVRAQGAFVIVESLYEGGRYLIVNDRDGRETELDAVPNFSRNGSRLILCVNGVYSGFEVQVWKRDGLGFVKEWAAAPFLDYYTEYNFVRWRNETTADLEAVISEAASDRRRTQAFTLTLRNRNWTILAAGPVR